MSQQNKTTLQANINTDLADNTTGDISASDIRGNLINITDSLLFNSGSQTFDGTLSVNGTVSGSFEGNGSNLTGVTAEWDGTLDGTAAITGSLEVTGGITGSLLGTGSYALNALTASYALSSAGGGGSTFPYTGAAEISGSLTVEGPTVLSGSLDVSGSVTIGRQGGLGHDLGVYAIHTASFEIDYLDMEVYESTVLNAVSIGSTQGSFEIKNTTQFGGTKGYIKLNAGDLLITGSAMYIKPSSLPTSEPSDSGQLWLSGSAGNSKYLMVRD